LDTDGDGLDDAAYTAWKTQILRRGFIWEEALATADGKNKTDAQYTGKEILLKKLGYCQELSPQRVRCGFGKAA